MRDPARIDPLIEDLHDLWKRYPDMRLCQLIVNLTNSTDPFYVEDTALEQAIQRWKEDRR